LVAHPAFCEVTVEPLDERAAVGVAELIRDDMRWQAALHQQNVAQAWRSSYSSSLSPPAQRCLTARK
jgi:hypothetical protein